ncbi:MAG: tRNA lysidine(34) synthetase TilS C-terminal domain-containing protein [Saprospiraceae bacterium]
MLPDGSRIEVDTVEKPVAFSSAPTNMGGWRPTRVSPDGAALAGRRLLLPFRHEGRRQKLQDFFTNRKIDRIDRHRQWLLCNADGAIIWVVGLQPDERFKITDATNRVLRFTFVPLS